MVESYVVSLALIGLVILGAALLPEWLAGYPVSAPMIYVLVGALAFRLPLGLPEPDPLVHGTVAERLSEFVVIVALMSAGLKLDRPLTLNGWTTTWRLLAITMPLTIFSVALLMWGIIGLAPASALLAGAALAPTDPVLASDVQVGKPAKEAWKTGEEAEPEVRFALTSEAGLNDGLAFPFTYLAVSIAMTGLVPSAWIYEWIILDVVYRIGFGILIGYALGWWLARFVFRVSPQTAVGSAVQGVEALGVTLAVYGCAEIVQSYGFIAVFVAALVLRAHERTHEYNEALHDFAETIERMALAVLLVLFGGAIAHGLLAPLTLPAALIGGSLLFLIRPLASEIGLLGARIQQDERLVISFFGIRGIGSTYYLAYGLNQASFPEPNLLWAFVGFVILLSVLVHGVTAPIATHTVDFRS